MLNNGTRDVHRNLIKACQTETQLKAFIDFVKTEEKEQLAVCLRGGNAAIGAVTVYRHNHMIWNLGLDGETGIVEVSMNHCRFMENWDTYAVKGLMELGFTPVKNELAGYDYDMLVTNRKLVSYQKSSDSYDVVELRYVIKETDTYESLYALACDSYRILKDMMESYFHPKPDNMVEVYFPSKKEYKFQPLNFPKIYYLQADPANAVTQRLYARDDACVEKHVQQEIFLKNHKQEDGLFVYDLEFVQPKTDKPIPPKSNKPDMFALRFQNGKMASIAMVEVKSTESAFDGECSLEKHIEGMLAYATAHELMEDRRKEACRIRNQFAELGLYGLSGKENEEDFTNEALPIELILVFTNGYRLNSITEKSTKTLRQRITDALDNQTYCKTKITGQMSSYSSQISYGAQAGTMCAVRIEVTPYK